MHTAETEDYELVAGELIPLSCGTPRHARIRQNVEYRIADYLEQNPVDITLAEINCCTVAETVRRPDLSIFLGERIQQVDMNSTLVPFAPDIAVEVLSRSETAMDVRRKVREYLRAGSKEVWIMDHFNIEVEVHTNTGIRLLHEVDPVESPLLPGFTAKVADLIACSHRAR
jgi:Uma2 family endonuclease